MNLRYLFAILVLTLSGGGHDGANAFLHPAFLSSITRTTTHPTVASAGHCSQTRTSSTTERHLFHRGNDPQALLRIMASHPPSSSSSLAFPLLLASTAAASPILSSSSITVGGAGGVGGLLHQLPSASSLLSDPLKEAEMLSDFHIAFDLLAFMGPTSKTAPMPIRLASILGRILGMAADYIPDHKILPEECIFQFFMLGIAITGLVRASLPTLLAFLAQPSNNSKSMSMRDRKVYAALFAPLGMTWPQYKALSTFALDWTTVEPGQVILHENNNKNNKMDSTTTENKNDDDEQYMYWLYSGHVIVSSKGKVLFDKRANATSFRKDIGKRLLGENCLWHCVGSECSLLEYNTGSAGGEENDPFPSTTATAGPEGATLLRIHKRNLDLLMNISDDKEQYAEPMRKLVFAGFKDKLVAGHMAASVVAAKEQY